jgi:hypothetical protein
MKSKRKVKKNAKHSVRRKVKHNDVMKNKIRHKIDSSVKSIRAKYKALLFDREKHNKELHHNLKPITDRLEEIAKNTVNNGKLVHKKME